jgi:hypothetical protein
MELKIDWQKEAPTTRSQRAKTHALMIVWAAKEGEFFGTAYLRTWCLKI